jgi:hypothetical protein
MQHEAVAEPRNLTVCFLQGQVVPHFSNALNRIDRVSDLLTQMPDETSILRAG